MYGEEAQLIYRRGDSADFITSANGVRQGCILGSLLYSLSVQNFYTRALEGRGSAVNGVAIIDDFYLFGQAQQSLEAYDEYTRQLVGSGSNCIAII